MFKPAAHLILNELRAGTVDHEILSFIHHREQRGGGSCKRKILYYSNNLFDSRKTFFLIVLTDCIPRKLKNTVPIPIKSQEKSESREFLTDENAYAQLISASDVLKMFKN